MYRFTKKQRLLTKPDYDAVFNNAKKIKTENFLFLFKKNTLGFPRLGLALSKKKIPQAHDRNRAKRLMREMFRLKVTLAAIDIVVLARCNVNWANRAEVVTQLSAVWNELSNQ